MTQLHPTPADVVQRMYEAFAARDEIALRELLAADIHWQQCAGFPGGAERRGVDDVIASVFAGNRATWEGFAAPVREYLADGERVVALGHYEGRHAESGETMHAVFAHVYTVRDGRITHFEQIADTWPMVRAMRGERGQG